MSFAVAAMILAAGAAAFGGEPREDDAKLITCRAHRVSLLEALKLVCQLGGLKMRVEGGVVMLVPANAPDGPIIHRSYDVLPNVTEKAEAVRVELRLLRAGKQP